MAPVFERTALGCRLSVHHNLIAARIFWRCRARVRGGDPVVGVLPGCGGDGGVRLGRVTGMRWVGDVGGVEVGAEGDRVIGITLQGANAQVFRCGLGWAVRVFQGVGNRLGQQRVCADLDEGVVGAVGAATGGSDGLLEAHGVAHVGGPVFGVEDRLGVQVCVGGGDDSDGGGPWGQIGQLRTHRRLQRIHGRIVRGDFDIDPTGKPVLRAHPGDQLIDLFGRPGDHGLPRRVVDPHCHLRVVRD
ncbi:Uncharacterised protein [Mycobacterium tuberculosis]|uniref:Uncharacterized protein n=1 Tax=Mycobacterium tuberculosis TaxID=1773 RepID=A0A655JRQ5_MYCTX|nr:Uncharacterised protein [Mycobacterium tuberculosis]